MEDTDVFIVTPRGLRYMQLKKEGYSPTVIDGMLNNEFGPVPESRESDYDEPIDAVFKVDDATMATEQGSPLWTFDRIIRTPYSEAYQVYFCLSTAPVGMVDVHYVTTSRVMIHAALSMPLSEEGREIFMVALEEAVLVSGVPDYDRDDVYARFDLPGVSGVAA